MLAPPLMNKAERQNVSPHTTSQYLNVKNMKDIDMMDMGNILIKNTIPLLIEQVLAVSVSFAVPSFSVASAPNSTTQAVAAAAAAENALRYYILSALLDAAKAERNGTFAVQVTRTEFWKCILPSLGGRGRYL
jgi:hypothetical protein